MKKIIFAMLLSGTVAWAAQPTEQQPQVPAGTDGDMPNLHPGPRTSAQEQLSNPELQNETQEQRMKRNRSSRTEQTTTTRTRSNNKSSTGVGNTHTDSSTNTKTERDTDTDSTHKR